MTSPSDDERTVLEERRRGDLLLQEAHLPILAVMTGLMALFGYAWLMRAAAPFAFIPAFLIATLVMIFGIAYVMVVMIRMDV